jgi:hypothetical protein
MANPKPKLENLKHFKTKGAAPLTCQLFVRVTQEVGEAVKALPKDERPEWLRRVITEAVKRELMKDGES